MDAQRSHFRQYLSITLVLLFLLSLAALGYAAWQVERGYQQGWMILLNLLVLSLPLALIFGPLYVLLLGRHERSSLGKVSPGLARIIHWAPRLAALLIVFFTGLFSLDVFGTGAPPLEVLGAFLLHNIPAIAMLVLLALAWKRPAVGFAAFLVIAAVFTLLFVRDFYALTNLVLFVLPMLLIASLFYADWRWLAP